MKFMLFAIGFIYLFTTGRLNAQESKIYQVTEDKITMKELLSQDDNIEFDRLYNLIYDLQPTIYIENNTINQTSDRSSFSFKTRGSKFEFIAFK